MVVVGSNFRNRTELRKKPRRSFHYSARILTDKVGTVVSCSIADISETGARIVLEDDCELPEEFVLLLTPTGDARRRCNVVWRTGTTVGVAFPEPHP
jgi:PilZ domain